MDFSLLGLWGQMGAVAKTVVVILLGMSMYAIGIALERFLTFRRSWQRSVSYLAALQPLVGSGGRLQEAIALERQYPDAPVARVLGPAVTEFAEGVEQLGPGRSDPIEIELLVNGISRSMERGKKREIAGLQRGLSVLATISSSAPFVGLFGTVFGIITAFQQMADPSKGGGGGLASVSAGIAEALLTTAVGLAVAIASVWFYNFFVTRLDSFGVLVDDTSGELADKLLRSTRGGRAAPL
ncbi:MAG TPA: MotA/TolQ/ExbB proton channel family protein [Polyangia bacterium]|nr:MotA/TolQ/ExbB proton channel family protein [Polyangia bacterium]